MALTKENVLTGIARGPTARANLVALGLLLLTASLLVAALDLSFGGGEGASFAFIARALGVIGGLFLALAFLLPAVSDAEMGTAVRIAYLAAGIIVVAGFVILPFRL